LNLQALFETHRGELKSGRSLKLNSIVTRAEKPTRMDGEPNLSREVKPQWAGSRETISTSVEESTNIRNRCSSRRSGAILRRTAPPLDGGVFSVDDDNAE